LETYRRCRQMLSVVLGVSPSPQTEKLAERARRQ
jgi:DNA-binding SARP family transcriptional activator